MNIQLNKVCCQQKQATPWFVTPPFSILKRLSKKLPADKVFLWITLPTKITYPTSRFKLHFHTAKITTSIQNIRVSTKKRALTQTQSSNSNTTWPKARSIYSLKTRFLTKIKPNRQNLKLNHNLRSLDSHLCKINKMQTKTSLFSRIYTKVRPKICQKINNSHLIRCSIWPAHSLSSANFSAQISQFI